MIEVERKFVIEAVATARLLDQAEEDVYTTILIDEYYDDEKLSLTTSDRWLRRRSKDGKAGTIELKKAIEGQRNGTDIYAELEGCEAIARELSLPITTDSKKALENVGLHMFACIQTKRVSVIVHYKERKVRVDLDEMDFGYTVGEIEILVETADEVVAAESIILDFAAANDLSITAVRGKVLEYIHRKRPEHYKLLLANIRSH